MGQAGLGLLWHLERERRGTGREIDSRAINRDAFLSGEKGEQTAPGRNDEPPFPGITAV